MLVIGTSLVVYPAAGLIQYTRPGIPKYLIDPGAPRYSPEKNLTFINEKAAKAVPELVSQLLADGF